MHFRIIAVGRVREPFIRDGIAEYTKRLAPYGRVEIVETREEGYKPNLSAAEENRIREREGEGLLQALSSGYVVAMDSGGKMLSSEELAEHVAELQLRSVSTIQFIIGGSLGLSPAVLDRADLRLSFGRVTYPHQLFRLILLEQLYRATTIVRGIPYHK